METEQQVLLIPEDEKEANELFPLPIEQDYKGLSYIPWLEARIALNKRYPNLIVSYKVNSQKIDDTLSYAFILLYLEDVKTKAVSQTLYYPVMRRGNRKNGEADFVAVENPTPLHVNTAIMRGSAKLVAIETGLGRAAYRKDKEDLVLDGVFGDGNETNSKQQQTKKLSSDIFSSPKPGFSIPAPKFKQPSPVPKDEENPQYGKPLTKHLESLDYQPEEEDIF